MEMVTLRQNLERHTLRSQLVHHPFFSYLDNAVVSHKLAADFVGQWWHPLHYFPTFLSRLIASAESIKVRTATSRILFQELGEGDVSRAHEVIYISTMKNAGFTVEQITGQAPLQTTAALVDGYATAATKELTGIGFMYATEVADLAMVSAIGTAVRRAAGPMKLEWVDIHIQQEPAHVQEADTTLSSDFSPTETTEIMTTAEVAWRLWIGFFDSLSALAQQTRAA